MKKLILFLALLGLSSCGTVASVFHYSLNNAKEDAKVIKEKEKAKIEAKIEKIEYQVNVIHKELHEVILNSKICK